jgi:hypothetical protein
MFGYLKRLFGAAPIDLAPGRGWVVDVAGEAQFQPALKRLKGKSEHDLRVLADLLPEPENHNDPNAVRVEIRGCVVGYLPRERAAEYTLKAAGRCSAKIVGGFELDDGTVAHLGVKLNLSWPPKVRPR